MKHSIVLVIFVLLCIPTMSFAQLLNETFEGDWESAWYSDFGVWQVGSPTNGPGAAYQGTNCLAVGLIDNYPSTALSKFININPVVVPNASLNPRLRFESWFIFNEHSGDRDHGRVLIKPVAEAEWTQIGENVIANSGGTWFNAYYDLSAYAGQAVQIAFEIDVWDTTSWPYDDPNEGPGWFIDNIKIETGAAVFNNPETWENGIGDWYVTNGTWEVGTPTNGPGAAFAGNQCLATRLDVDYWGRAYSRIVSPSYMIPPITQKPRMRFESWYIFNEHNGDSDHGRVLVKPFGSNEWTQLDDNVKVNSGGIWFNAYYDLSTYAGQAVQFAFEIDVWDTTSWPYDDPNEGPGWFIDNIKIETGAAVFNNPETWENGIGDWYVTNGTWEVGTPTNGPGAAFAGNQCLATRLDVDYWGRAYSRIVSPVYAVPSNSQNPRLRFQTWHIFSEHNGDSDHGRVLIKRTSETEWQQLGDNITINSGGIWFINGYDLSDYAGQLVQIAFEIDVWDTTSWPYDDPNEGPGWFIDDIKIETDTAVFNNPETWENGIGDWNVSCGTWEVGTPSNGPGSAFEGINCLATNLFYDYWGRVISKIISPNIVVPTAVQNPRLRFQTWYSFNQHNNGSDHGSLLIKSQETEEWFELDNLNSTSGDIWFDACYDLSDYAGQTVQIAFELDVWDTTSWPYDGPNEAPGWFIDNVRIETGATTFNNPESWENGIGDWYVTKGFWEVGIPTTGPNSSYDGSKCLATRLNGDYFNWANTMIISPPVTVPLASQYPRFSFMEWHSFNQSDSNYDHGRVLIKPSNDSTWVALSGNFFSNSSSVWSYVALDLGAYAGQSVQFAFQLDSWYNDEGWYIDKVEIKTGIPVFNNPETWESGIGDWSVTNGTWEVGTPHGGPNAAYQGTKCLATKLDGNYFSGVDSRVISPVFSLSPTIVPILRFRSWYNIGASDTCFVQIKPVNSNTWTNLTGGVYTGSTGGTWNYTYFQLTSFLGQQVQLGFYINSDGGSSSGWYIDNVTLLGNNINPTVVNPISDITMAEDSQSTFNILNTFYDPDVVSSGQVLFYGCYENPHIDISFNQSSGLVTITPHADWFGTENLTFYASDQNGGIAYDDVLVTATPVNDPIILDFPNSITIFQNEVSTIDCSEYIHNPDGDILAITISGNLDIPILLEESLITLSPSNNWVGSELLTISVDDPSSLGLRYQASRNRVVVSAQFRVIVINPLIVDFSTDSILNNNVVANDTQTGLQFSATSNLPLSSYQWDFDNDSVIDSDSDYPYYIYTSPGVKSVKLIASDGVHVTEVTKMDFVNVLPGTLVPPQAFDTNVVWTEEGGPYNISGELIFNEGISLTVEPNAQVNLMVDDLLIVNGTINAQFADFNAYGPSGWGGLVLNPASNNSVINGINLYGAATGITVIGCNPQLSNLEINGSTNSRTLTTGISITAGAAPTISNITINNFNQGIIASNNTPDPESLILSNVRVNRISASTSPDDVGILVQGDISPTLNEVSVLNYPRGIEIINETTLRRPARLTNSRVAKTENSTRNLDTALHIVNVSYVVCTNDSLIGYNKGIEILNSDAVATTDLLISSNTINFLSPAYSPDYAVQITGIASGVIDSLYINGYSKGIVVNGNSSLDIFGNLFRNCGIAFQDLQNHQSHTFSRNTIHRNGLYLGNVNYPALSLNQSTNLSVINNTIYDYPNAIYASNGSSLSYEQNISWCILPSANPIMMVDVSDINATYNDIAISSGVYPGVGNINADPLFIDVSSENFALSFGSPCINSGNPANPLDPDMSIADIGALIWDVTSVPLVSDFTCNSLSGQHPLNVQFTNLSSSFVLSWSWDFDNNGTVDSNDTNPLWIYTAPGVYTVKLTVWDGVRYESRIYPNLITVLNTGPAIVLPIPDMVADEDFTSCDINLNNYFSDSNGDQLVYSFSTDTNLVDAIINQNILTISSIPNLYGVVNITITAEDGNPAKGTSQTTTRSSEFMIKSSKPRVSLSDNFSFTINPINDSPVIASYNPVEDSLDVPLGTELSFSVTAYDVDSPIQYHWYVNDVLQTNQESSLNYQFSLSQVYLVKAKVSDGLSETVVQWRVSTPSAVEDITQVVSTALNRIYPNPFHSVTTIEYQLKDKSPVKIEVFNVKGQLVRTLVDKEETPGVHSAFWSSQSQPLPTGIYFIRVSLKNYTEVKRVIYLK